MVGRLSVIYNSEDMEATQVPSIDRWMKKLWYIYTMEYYWIIKKNDILPFVTAGMDLEGIMLNEIGQSERDKHHMISLICEI